MRVGGILRKWRIVNELSLREAATNIGISHSTLGRIESGDRTDSDTLMLLFIWLFGPEPTEPQEKERTE